MAIDARGATRGVDDAAGDQKIQQESRERARAAPMHHLSRVVERRASQRWEFGEARVLVRGMPSGGTAARVERRACDATREFAEDRREERHRRRRLVDRIEAPRDVTVLASFSLTLGPGEVGALDLGSIRRAPAADYVIVKPSYWSG
jgi:hypothetical protein